MRFYPPDSRRRPAPPFYRQQFRPSNRMGRQADYYYSPNQFRRPDQANFYAEQFRRQYYPPNQYTRQDSPFSNPYEQQRPSRFGRLPQHFNTLMGHAGTLQNGVNMMRQISSLLGMFR